MNCPKCDSPETYSPATDEWGCEYCGHKWSTAEPASQAFVPVADKSTPDLVREFAALKTVSATGRMIAELHARLGDVVDELRRRNVLD